MGKMEHRVESLLAGAWPAAAWQDVTVLLAVSGGPDSVALLRAMVALKTAGAGRLIVAHVNHHLRGAESEADQSLVVELCGRLGVRCEVAQLMLDPSAGHRGQGLEAMARRARYGALQQAAARLGARYVVTAHTADDQAETILHRILRGAGIRGVAGMTRTRPLGPATLIRPLLGIRRADLLAYLDDLGQAYRHDSSNLDVRFTRNRIRHDLLPRLARQFNPGIVDALLRLGSLAGECQSVIDHLVDQLVDRCVRSVDAETVRITREGLADPPRYVVREMLLAVWRRQRWPMQAMGFDQWEQLAEMLLPNRNRPCSRCEKHVFPGCVVAEVSGDALRLTRQSPG